MKQTIAFFSLLFGLSGTVYAGIVDHDTMYDAYLNGDMEIWSQKLTEYTSSDNLTINDKIEISNYLYGYIGFILQDAKKPVIEHWLELWEKYLHDIEAAARIPSTLHVYRSSIAAYRTKLYPFKILMYARQSMDELEMALAENPKDPIAVGLKGNVLFYLPKMMGGDKDEAIEWYRHAIELHENNPDILYRWNVCGIRLCLAQAYEETDRRSFAVQVCKETLEIEPNFSYIRDTYLPKLLSKH